MDIRFFLATSWEIAFQFDFTSRYIILKKLLLAIVSHSTTASGFERELTSYGSRTSLYPAYESCFCNDSRPFEKTHALTIIL